MLVSEGDYKVGGVKEFTSVGSASPIMMFRMEM